MATAGGIVIGTSAALARLEHASPPMSRRCESDPLMPLFW
jgi:hypothetical protein